MKIETLKKDNKKKIAIGVIAVISIVSTIILASLKDIREEYGLNQSEVASILGVTRSTYSVWEIESIGTLIVIASSILPIK